MDSVSETTPSGSTVSRETVLNRLLIFAYLTVVAVAMFGWVSALWWVTVTLAKWLIA
jgi:hypothetical protein